MVTGERGGNITYHVLRFLGAQGNSTGAIKLDIVFN